LQPDIDAIPFSSIGRIEILPSIAAVMYGGGATGGVVNIVLRRNYTVRSRPRVKHTRSRKRRRATGARVGLARTERLESKAVEEAITWVVRLQDGDKSWGAEFLKWYFAHPCNAKTFDPIRRAWLRTGQLKAQQLLSIEERCQTRDSRLSLALASGCFALLGAVPVAIDVTGIPTIGTIAAPMLSTMAFFFWRFHRCRKAASAARLAVAAQQFEREYRKNTARAD
jgi:hypothetical protein